MPWENAKKRFVVGWTDDEEKGEWACHCHNARHAIERFVSEWLRAHTTQPDSYWIEVCGYCLTSHREGGCSWRERLAVPNSSGCTVHHAGLRSG